MDDSRRRKRVAVGPRGAGGGSGFLADVRHASGRSRRRTGTGVTMIVTRNCSIYISLFYFSLQRTVCLARNVYKNGITDLSVLYDIIAFLASG